MRFVHTFEERIKYATRDKKNFPDLILESLMGEYLLCLLTDILYAFIHTRDKIVFLKKEKLEKEEVEDNDEDKDEEEDEEEDIIKVTLPKLYRFRKIFFIHLISEWNRDPLLNQISKLIRK